MHISEFRPKVPPPDRVIELTGSTTLAEIRTIIRANVRDDQTYKTWWFLDPFLNQPFATMHAFHVWLIRQDRPDGCDVVGWSDRYLKTQALLGERFTENHIGSDAILGHCLMFMDHQDDWELSVYANKCVRRGKDEFQNLSSVPVWTVLNWLHQRTMNTLWVLKEKHNIEWHPFAFIKHAFEVFQSGKNLEYKPTTAPTFIFA